jgi:hypothetical protein
MKSLRIYMMQSVENKNIAPTPLELNTEKSGIVLEAEAIVEKTAITERILCNNCFLN